MVTFCFARPRINARISTISSQMPSTKRSSRAVDKGVTAHNPAKRKKTEKSHDDKKRRKVTVEQENTDYPQRVTSLWKIGAHVSAAGGVENAIHNAAAIGANAFALFLKSQRKWESPPLTDASIAAFKSRMNEFGYESRLVLPHGSYLINLANPDNQKREKSYECFLDDLQRCEQLGLELYNFHPGSTVGATTADNSIALIARCINRAHKATSSVVTVLENMAGSNNIIGSAFGDLGAIIRQVEDKSRVGVCLDTCHAFAAGYDIRTKEGWESTLSNFDAQVGLSYLRAIHLNDSKMPFNSKRDRHENIGIGHIGLRGFHHVVTDKRTQNLPIILETPNDEKPAVWAKEVEILNTLSGLDLSGEVQSSMMVSEWVDAVRAVVGTRAVAKKSVKRRSKPVKRQEDTEGSESVDR